MKKFIIEIEDKEWIKLSDIMEDGGVVSFSKKEIKKMGKERVEEIVDISIIERLFIVGDGRGDYSEIKVKVSIDDYVGDKVCIERLRKL